MKTSSSLSRLTASFAVILSTCLLTTAQTVIVYAPVTLVQSNTPGYYNSALGTILDGTAPQFPTPLGAGGGDPLINPSAEPNLSAASSILGNWFTPHSTLNSNWQQRATIPATWAGNTETAIIYEISGGTHGITNLTGNFDADNGVFVWVNGQFRFGAREPGLPTPAGQFEYTNVFLGHLLPGTNRIQIIREDNFDATGYQVQITGQPLGGTPLPTCATTSPSLIGWWRAEGGGLDSAGTNTGILLGGAGIAAGKVGQAFTFDGVDDSVRIPVPGPFTILDVGINTGFTIEAWVNPSRLTIGPIAEWNNGAGGEGAHFWHSVDSIAAGDGPGNLYANIVDISGVSHQIVAPSGLLVTNTYSHVALTYDRNTGVAVIYHNGIAVKTQNLGIFTPQTSFDFHIGRRASGFFSENLFKGSIDEVSLYFSALTAAEIQAIAAAGSLGKCGGTNPPVVNCAPTPTGLVSWWRAESGVLDSVGTNHGALAGNATFGSSKVGQGLVFDGSADVVSVGNAPALQLQNFSIETWIRRTSTAQVSFGSFGNGVIFGFGQNGYGLYLDPNGAPALSKIGLTETKPAAAITDTNFHHLAVTKSGSVVIFYIDGVAHSAPAYDPGFTFTSVAAIGARGDNLDNSFLGVIDEVSVYNRVLTPAEIQAIVAADSNGKCATNPPVVNCAPAPTGLVSWWQADGDGSDSADGNNGTLLNGANFAEGKVGQSFSFDGVNDHVRVTDQPNLRMTNGLTIEGWFYPTIIGGDRELVSKWDSVIGPDQRSFTVALQSDGRAYLGLSGDGVSVSALVLSANPIPANQWSYLAVTYDGAALRIYINGILENQTSYSGGIFPGTSDVGIAQNVGGSAVGSSPPFGAPYAGRIDELGIYNRALTAGEIAAIYNASGTGKCPPLPQSPLITQHPQDRTVNAGATAQFTVAATGSPTLRYQWFFGENPLSGATNPTLSISNASPIHQGLYRATVSNAFGFAISSNALLTVLTLPPTITRQPTNVTVIVGNAATLSVQATGSVTLAYQWLSNGVPMPGRTSTSLAFQSAQFSNAANYSVIVTNPYGAVTSSVAVLTVNPRPPCAPVHDGLVSWWKGENNAIDNWDSNNGVNLGRTYPTGKVGLAFSSPLISVSDSPSLRVTSGLTIEAWINPSSSSSARVLVSKFEYPVIQPFGTQSAYLLGTTNGALFFTLTPNGSVRTNTTLVTTNLIPLNQWTHVAATYDGAVMRLYINGSQIRQTNHVGNIFPGSTPLGIGGFAGSSPWQYFGLIDEVSLYNRALSAAEIQSIVAADLTGKCAAPPVITQQPLDQIVPLGEDVKFTVGVSGSRPLAYQWYFSNPARQFLNERIIGATNAFLLIEKIRTNNVGFYFVTVTNSVGSNSSARAQLSTVPAPSCVDILPGLISWWPGDTNTLDAMGLNNISLYTPPSYPTGKVASAFTFNGLGNRITVNNSASLNFTNNQNFSIEMWIKATNSPAQASQTYPNVPLLEKRDSLTIGWLGYSLSLNNGKLAFTLGAPISPISGGNTNRMFISTSPDLRDGFFHHVAVTVNRTENNGGVLYVDGSPVLVFDPRGFTNSLLTQAQLYIGGPATTLSNSYYTGLIDEPAIYGRSLTPAEILSIRTAGAAGRCRTKPVILTQPVGGSVAMGSNFTMGVTASGTPLLRYQWRRNNSLLFGATNATYNITNFNNSHLGTYSVIVSNAFGSVTSSNAAVTLANQPPVAMPASLVVREDSTLLVGMHAFDPDSPVVAYTIVQGPTNGVLSGVSNSPVRFYTPNSNFNGRDSFTFVASDGFATSAPAVISITVLPINDAPVAFSEQFAMDEDTALPIQLRADDVDDAELSFEIVQQPAHGTLTGSGSKRIYTPAQDYFGDDYFTFIARDGSNAVSQIAVVSITVRPINDAPVAKIIISPLDQLPGETNTVLIAPACCDATLVLDGSQSSDVDDTELTYIWMDGTNVIATTATFTNQFAPGVHELVLIVSDGELTGTELLTVEILKTEEAVLHLQSLVQTSSLARNEKAALGNWLRVTVTALEHCNVDQAVMFLERFEGRVAERISIINAQDAERWIAISQAIREVAGLCDPAHRPGGGNGNSEAPKSKSKSEQEGNSGGRGNSDEVRGGKSSPR